MRIATKTHLSVVGGLARFARVTVGACSPEERLQLSDRIEYYLNDRLSVGLSDEDISFIQAARESAEMVWRSQNRKDEVPVVLKIDLALVDMHIDAVKAAAKDAAAALFSNDENA